MANYVTIRPGLEKIVMGSTIEIASKLPGKFYNKFLVEHCNVIPASEGAVPPRIGIEEVGYIPFEDRHG